MCVCVCVCVCVGRGGVRKGRDALFCVRHVCGCCVTYMEATTPTPAADLACSSAFCNADCLNNLALDDIVHQHREAEKYAPSSTVSTP